jgi:NAD-dependent dihydropyrimidine dehydrogenase PreA subunit
MFYSDLEKAFDDDKNDSDIIWFLNEDCLTACPQPGFDFIISDHPSGALVLRFMAPGCSDHVVVPIDSVDQGKEAAKRTLALWNQG